MRASVMLVMLVAFSAFPVFAQEAEVAAGAESEDEDRRVRAQALFVEALPLLTEQRYVEARDLLRDSLALVPHQSTAYNLAMAQRELGEALMTRDLIAQLLAGEFEGELSEDQLTLIHELRRQVEGDLARVSVVLEPADPAAIVFIDDAEQGHTTDGPFPANPGDHVVRIESEGHDVVVTGTEEGSASITLRRGEELTLSFVRTPRPVETLFTEPPPRRGWIAGVVVGAALLAGAAVVVGVILAGRTADPEVDPIFGRVETLSFGR